MNQIYQWAYRTIVTALHGAGNMLFMLLGIVRQQPKGETSWLYPKYFPMLRTWADELVRTTEFPADQICTDDFTGVYHCVLLRCVS